MVPRAVARLAVRSMRASTSCSIRQLMAKAAAASSQMPSVPNSTRCMSGMPGAARNMPMTAQNTASCVTRGSEHEILAEQSGLGSGKTGHDGPYFKRAPNWGRSPRRRPSGGGQTHHQYHRRQRQAGRPAIVQHRDQKRPLEEDGGQPGQQLRAQQRQHQRGRSAQPGLGAQAPGQHAQVGEHHEGEIAMDPVDRGERRLRDHFAGRQLAQPRITE